MLTLAVEAFRSKYAVQDYHIDPSCEMGALVLMLRPRVVLYIYSSLQVCRTLLRNQ